MAKRHGRFEEEVGNGTIISPADTFWSEQPSQRSATLARSSK